MAHRDFILEWDKELGFREDPFTDKIFSPISAYMVDRAEEKEKLNWFFIKGYFFGAIIGDRGVGKTTLLRWLEDRVKKYNRIVSVYINAEQFKDQVNIPQQMLMPLLSFYERTITKPHTKMVNVDYIDLVRKKIGGRSIVLLIDNAQHLTQPNLELLKNLRLRGIRFSIIITSTPSDYKKSRLQELGQDDLEITLRRLTFDEAKEMIHRRIANVGGKANIISDHLLLELFEKADKNPREFLHLCRDETIRLLIHKKDADDRQHLRPYSPDLGIKEEATIPVTNKMKERESKSEQRQKQSSRLNPAQEELRLKKILPQRPQYPAFQESAVPQPPQKKKFLNIRFDMGKQDKERSTQPLQNFLKQQMPTFKFDRPKQSQSIYDDKHRENLVNQLSSSSPRKQAKEARESRDNKKDKGGHLSDADRILKELSDEFER